MGTLARAFPTELVAGFYALIMPTATRSAVSTFEAVIEDGARRTRNATADEGSVRGRELLVTVREAALEGARFLLYQHLQRGPLPSAQIGRVRGCDLEAFVKRLQEEQQEGRMAIVLNRRLIAPMST